MGTQPPITCKITSLRMMKTFTIFMALAAIAAVAVADEKADLLNDILTGPVPESALELDNLHDLSEHVDRNNDNCGGKRHFGWSNCAQYSHGHFSSHDALHQCRSAGYNAWCGRNQDCGRACWAASSTGSTAAVKLSPRMICRSLI